MDETFALKNYSVCAPSFLQKSWGVWASSGRVTVPLFYLTRPAWITDDSCWEQIVKSIVLDLPEGTVIR